MVPVPSLNVQPSSHDVLSNPTHTETVEQNLAVLVHLEDPWERRSCEK